MRGKPKDNTGHTRDPSYSESRPEMQGTKEKVRPVSWSSKEGFLEEAACEPGHEGVGWGGIGIDWEIG